MARPRYILRNFAPGSRSNNVKQTNNLFNLSSIGIDANQTAIKTSLALGSSETNTDYYDSGTNVLEDGGNIADFLTSSYAKYRDITKASGGFIAFFNQTYQLRRDYLRQFAKNGEITFVLDTISDEAIVPDENNYVADLDLDKLKLGVNANNKYSEQLIKTAQQAFKRIYAMYGFDKSNDAWGFFKKFLIDGFLAFEIIYEYDNNKNAKNIIAFKELDPVTLQPEIVKDNNGNDIMVWYQNKGDKETERIIPDSNLIYISWCKGNFIDSTNISYLEGLTRSFNMLRQLENSRIIWNIENAQKRVKISVPVGDMSTDRARQRLSELRAFYNEETVIDDFSGEVTVNGMPKFSFTKTFLFPSQGGNTTDIGEIGSEGYDMNSTEQLLYFYNRFVLESKIPANRFPIGNNAPNNQMIGDANVTREEYAFGRFIQRLRSAYKEIFVKPLYLQICLQIPTLQKSDYLKTCLGIKYNEENLFTLAKERAIASEGAQTIQSLQGINGFDGQPYFSPTFLIKKYLGLSDEDIQLNEKYKIGEDEHKAKIQKKQKENAPEQTPLEGQDESGFGGAMGGFGTNSFGRGEDNGFGEAEEGGTPSSDIGEASSEAAPSESTAPLTQETNAPATNGF